MKTVLKSFKRLLSVSALLLLLITNNILQASTPPHLTETGRIYGWNDPRVASTSRESAKSNLLSFEFCGAGGVIEECRECGWQGENEHAAVFGLSYYNPVSDSHFECVPVALSIKRVFNENLNNGTTCDAGSEGTNSATGNNFQRATDIPSSGSSSIPFSRSFNSNGTRATSSLGDNWQHNFSASIARTNSTADVPVVAAMAHRPDGRSFNFIPSGSSWTPDTDVKATLQEQKDISGATIGWTYTDAGDRVENYDAAGKLTNITEKNGDTKALSYNSSGLLETVTNQYNQQLSFSYDVSGRLILVTDVAGGNYEYSYDASDNLIEVINPNTTSKRYQYNDPDFPKSLTASVDENGNNVATWTYDSQGRVIIRERAGGQDQTTYTYNTDGTTTITDVDGTSRTQSFYKINGVYKSREISGDPCATCGGQNASTTYDANGFVASKTDFNGNVTKYTHNARGLEISRIEASGTSQARTIATEWHSQYRVPVKITRPSVAAGKSAVTTIAYTNSAYPSLPTSITRTGFSPDGTSTAARKITIQYSPEGRVSQIDGARTDVIDTTSLTYYENTAAQGVNRGMLKTVTNALGHVVTYDQYDAFGNVVEMTDANGVKTKSVYDSRQRLVETMVVPSIGATRTTRYNYDGAGQLIKTTTPDGIALNYIYDTKKNLISVSDNLNNRIEYSYDEQGNRNQTVTKDSSGLFVRVVDYTHDAQDRINSINAAGSITQLVYDAVGNLVSQTDPNNNIPTTNNYDGLNRLTSAIDALSGVTSYDYDVNDRVVSVTVPNAADTIYSYDDLGNMLSEQSPDRGSRSYQYNEAGNLIKLTDARDITVNYNYDTLGRVLTVDYPGSAEDANFTYDIGNNCNSGVGRLCTMSDESGQTLYSYDDFGNVISQSHTESGIIYTTSYGYDAGDNVVQTIYPSGRVVNTARDILRRVSGIDATINSVQKPIVDDIQYRADNLKVAQRFGNGNQENRNYDFQGRLLEQGSTVSNGGLPTDLTISLSPSIPSPAPSSSTISFVAQPSDEGIYEYEFSLNGPGTGGVPQVTQAFSLSNVWNWNSTSNDTGGSVITVKARIAGGSSSSAIANSINYTIGVGPTESVILTASTVSPTVSGLPVIFQAQGVGGSGAYEYRFTVSGPSTGNIPVVQQAYSTASAFTLATESNQAGNYTVLVDVRNQGSQTDSEATANMVYELLAQQALTALDFSADLVSPQKAGTSITFTAQASGGNVGEYEYYFSRRGPDTNNAWVVTEYNSSNTYTLQTTEESSIGSHQVWVYARNKGSSRTHEFYRYLNYYVVTSIEPASTVSVTADLASPQKAGAVITFTAQASGGSVGEYEYNIGHKGPETSNVYQWSGYSPNNTFVFTSSEASVGGPNYVYVYARNKGSSKTFEAQKYLGMTIQTAIEPATSVTVTSELASPQLIGTPITLTAQGSGGNVGEYEYSFGHRGPSDGVYQYEAYSASNTFTFTSTDPADSGQNYFEVRVRNKGSSSIREARVYYPFVFQAASTSVIPKRSVQYVNAEPINMYGYLRRVGLSLPQTQATKKLTHVVIVRNTSGEGYNYWLKNESSKQHWQQLQDVSELSNIKPESFMYVDKDYVDVWYRSKDDDSAYHYKRINSAVSKNTQEQKGRFIKTAAGGSALATRSYRYDANGNVLDITTDQGVHNYGYDGLDRIINDASPNLDAIELNYDANGNRITDLQGLTNNSYNYSVGSNRLDTVNGQTISRDAAGNTIGDTSPVTNGSRAFEYNNANRLFKVYEAGSLVATYTYNALGQRTRKVTPTGTTIYHYDLQGQLISETESDGRVIKDYVWQGIEPVAQIDVEGANETVTYLHTDHLATPRSATNANGDVVWTWNSDAFGSTQAAGSVTVNLRFPGQYYDSETQLHYNWNRYYDPRVGRYITSDPIGLNGGMNTYGYVDARPLVKIDPKGLRGFCPGGRAVPAPGNEHAFPTIFMCESDGTDPKDSACNNISCKVGRPLPQTSNKTFCELDKDLCKLNCTMATMIPGVVAGRILDGGLIAGGAILAERKSFCELVCGIEHGF